MESTVDAAEYSVFEIEDDMTDEFNVLVCGATYY